MDLQLAGKTALVTGAGSGIGRAVALAFAREGANLVLCDRDQAACEQTLAQVAWSRSHNTRLAPSRAKASATARPMPDPAPVTSAVLPAS